MLTTASSSPQWGQLGLTTCHQSPHILKASRVQPKNSPVEKWKSIRLNSQYPLTKLAFTKGNHYSKDGDLIRGSNKQYYNSHHSAVSKKHIKPLTHPINHTHLQMAQNTLVSRMKNDARSIFHKCLISKILSQNSHRSIKQMYITCEARDEGICQDKENLQ